MEKDLLLKDGLLYFAFVTLAAGAPLLTTEYVVPALILYAMAGLALVYRTHVKKQSSKK